MAPKFRCKFKVHGQSLLQETKVYKILFQSRVNRNVCDVINFMINVILSYLLVMQFNEHGCVFFIAICVKHAEYNIRKFSKRTVLYLQSYDI